MSGWVLAWRLATAAVIFSTALGAPLSDTEPYTGAVGCRFSSELCLDDEVCIDDNIFGICQNVNDIEEGIPINLLTKEEQDELQLVLEWLVARSYTWNHPLTQCVLIGLLYSYRSDSIFDARICAAESLIPPTLTNEDQIPFDSKFSNRPQSLHSLRFENDKRASMYSMDDRPSEYEQEDDDSLRWNEGRSGEDVNGFEEYLNGLTAEDLETIKEFVLDNAREEAKESEQIVDKKAVNRGRNTMNVFSDKSVPGVITKVVVQYNPDGDSTGESSGADVASKSESSSPSSENSLSGTVPTVGTVSGINSGLLVKPVVIPVWNTLPPPTVPPEPITSAPIVPVADGISVEQMEKPRGHVKQKYLITAYVMCGLVGGVVVAAIGIYIMRRRNRLKEKVSQWVGNKTDQDKMSTEYKDLCRQHMQGKLSEAGDQPQRTSSPVKRYKFEPADATEATPRTGSNGSSTSSFHTPEKNGAEEPASSNIDISTGHILLSYMEDHFKDKDRLQREWETLCAYDAEPCSIVSAIEPVNMRKNRYTDILPYQHSRVRLNVANNASSSDYINANTITDHDPRNPAYIATQGPLPHTVADFWQMVWEQHCSVIVNLTRLTENGVSLCHRYWLEEGSDLYHIYEVHLVSEHAWCDDFIVRSFYLKNMQTNETRTVTQFHFLAWPNLGVPPSAKMLLDFRRKVNKSFRVRSSPIVVHCSDGAGRTGTYCLIDMVLNRLSKGAKEIDIAATLEHIRDQRINMVRTKEQFEFALTAVAEEVQAALQAPTNQQ